MAGANYMGGRRNAAKARSRDKTGRIQKDFFGRRRLNILSKGLAAAPRSRDVNSGGSVAATRASIELGHAKNVTVSQEALGSGLRKHKRDHSNITRLPSSPASKRSVQTRSSSIKSTKSKLLHELDFIEPHAAISSILAMDDLAGLRPSPNERMHLDSSQRSPSPVSSYDSNSMLEEEEDPIMEYESSGPFHHSSISSGSENGPGFQDTHRYQRLDDWFQQDALETEYMRKADSDQDRSPHSISSSKALIGAPTFTSQRCSSVSLMAQVSSASHEDESFSFLSVSNSGGPSAHRSNGRMSFVGNNLLPERSNASAQLMDPDIGTQMEGVYPNILDYSDPWEQIGMVMGLQANHYNPSKATRMLFTSQEERATACTLAEDEQYMEKQVVLESDLPPSDIIDESSLDDTLYSPSSLPIAGSSESTGPRPDSAVALPQIDPDGIWEVDFDDWAISLRQSQFDDTTAPNPPDVLAGDDSVSGGSAVIECGDAKKSRSFQQEEQQYSMKNAKNSDTDPPPVEDARSILAEVFPSASLAGEQAQSPHNATDQEPFVVNCGVRGAESGDVLAVPELLACNGVYQGPCLLSQGSEPDE